MGIFGVRWSVNRSRKRDLSKAGREISVRITANPASSPHPRGVPETMKPFVPVTGGRRTPAKSTPAMKDAAPRS